MASSSGDDDQVRTVRTTAKPDRSSSSSSESNDYFISTEDPVAAVAELGASGANLIGSNIVGSLWFEKQDREREFLSQARASFYFPLMEKELMKTWR
jgi:hypothetical protein